MSYITASILFSVPSGICFEPLGKFRFGNLACRKSECLLNCFGLRCRERAAVQFEKRHGQHKGDALVAVTKRMAATDGIRVICGQGDDVSLAVLKAMMWASQGRVESAFITKAGQTAMLVQESVVNRQGQ